MTINTVQPKALAIFTTDAQTLTMMWQTVVLGMAMIFAVLSVLWLILSVFKLVFAGKTPKAAKPEAKEAAKTAPAPKAEPAPSAQGNDELIAVITAAVAAYRAEEGLSVADGSFRVVSFTRVKGGRAWNSK